MKGNKGRRPREEKAKFFGFVTIFWVVKVLNFLRGDSQSEFILPEAFVTTESDRDKLFSRIRDD